MSARSILIGELRAHALVIGEVVLSSGRRASYYVDAKRAILLPTGFGALAELISEQARELHATAVGGRSRGRSGQ
jgi:orotate phosphoribosyltransferase